MGALTTQQDNLPKRSEQLSQNADQFINWLFDELAGTFPAWKSAFESQQAITTAKRIWFETLSENKIKRTEIQNGLRQARKSNKPFLPSVGQFIEWCKMIDLTQLGLPDVETLLKRLNYFSSFGFEGVDDFKFKSDAEYWLITDLYQRNQKYNWGAETLRKQAEQALADMAKQIQSGVPVQPRKVTIQKPKEYVPAHPLVEARIKAMQQAKGAQNGI